MYHLVVLYWGTRQRVLLCARSSVDRVPGYEPVGRGFESPRARHNVETKKMSLAKSPNISGFFATQTAIFLCTKTQM